MGSSVSGGQSGQRGSISGPITKIKEKSERSLGMDVARARASMDAGQSYGYDNETMAGYTRRQSAQPGSRNGSRPPSRTGSNLSLDSEDSPPEGHHTDKHLLVLVLQHLGKRRLLLMARAVHL